EEEEGEARGMDDLTCSVCSEVFEGGVREPVVLPQCGHTFCRACLINLQARDPAFSCPTCRSSYSGPPVADLPVAHPEVSWDACLSHGDPVRLWCCSCQEPLCGQCLFEQHMTDGHQVVKTQTALEQERLVIQSRADRVTKYIEGEKKRLTEKFRVVSLQLAKIYSHSKILSHHSKTVSDILRSTQESEQMKSLLINRSVLDKLLRKFEMTAGVSNSSRMTTNAKTVSSSEAKSESDDSEQESHTSTPDLDIKDDLQTLSQETPSEVCGHDSDTECNEEIASDTSQEESQEPDATQDHSQGPHVRQDNRQLTDVSNVDDQEPYKRDGVEVNSEFECPVWMLNQCAPGGSTHWPKINWYDFMAQLPVVQLLVPPEKPEVFLQLGVGDRILGRVHIRLWGHLRRAQHFLALCLGTLGPTFRGSRFSYVARKGEAGERLVGGVYMTEAGPSSHQLMEGLEWRGEYLGPAREGIVGGSRGRQAKYNSCFCISSKDNPIGQYYCPFGEVVFGLEVVKAAIRHDPVSDVIIVNTGLINPHM
ncbi:Tripartite motif-containing protein 72-like 2, partial [Homarus americanus]